MKIVTCKNCGAKYQLDNDENVDAFECPACAGDLELTEKIGSDNQIKDYDENNAQDDNFILTQCNDCGLKYALEPKDNILDYECENCGGSLKYVDKNLNEQLNNYLKENPQANIEIEEQSNEIIPEHENKLEKIPEKIGQFFSESNFYYDSDDEEEEEEKEQVTARTEIPNSIVDMYEDTDIIAKSNDYFELKEYLKLRFLKNMEKYYKNSKEDKRRFSLYKEEGLNIKKRNEIVPNKKNKPYHYIFLILGLILSLIGAYYLFSGNAYGIIIFTIGIALLCYGIYKTNDFEESEKRGVIIRNRLLTLPEEYYLLYFVKVPGSHGAINHVVIGPSGIYAIVTKKYKNKKQKSENENNNLVYEDIDNEDMIYSQNNVSNFKYTVKETEFDSENRIKQKSLRLGSDLMNFLHQNGLNNFFVEPLVGFVNDNVAVINTPLTDEDLFLDELLARIISNPVKYDARTVNKIAILLSRYAVQCSDE